MFEDLRDYSRGLFVSNSAIAGFAVWFLHNFIFTELPQLNKTRFEIILDATGKGREELMLEILQTFRRFYTKRP